MQVARSELILGGQKSGKSRRAELLAGAWLAARPSHRAVLVATAQAHDAEMQARIERHQRERAARVPGLELLEEPRDLAGALLRCSRPETLLVVDCLTLWLTHWLMPLRPAGDALHDASAWATQSASFFEALEHCPGPVVLVGNEIGLGVVPLGREVRAFVDALGLLNQQAAAACRRVTLMAAGLPLTLKDEGAP
ncbi:adenosylcobinamide kinase /adenosylcobinamide-phosphate guanylyltransferase [Melaminivora alkalimesophila]|uniref:Bifunctional adenosylcobalamin biosynthesis protein n=2 Tax=Melaminivora alkalimesophila TaxID=1165852 RepID=A0A317RD48_9BURK|nr:bifunctional adenosylcobinamide kinase/adenosylcobinamide-phosphate guanylyltransferase [Melaminivora alkalimesophila]PWW46254.1 adenosylcobinamide kinase /adenosylcobinamide-phosphate guanylyltransferase [Melaminivora alkalimesophila]